jgi:hypothetical protein
MQLHIIQYLKYYLAPFDRCRHIIYPPPPPPPYIMIDLQNRFTVSTQVATEVSTLQARLPE